MAAAGITTGDRDDESIDGGLERALRFARTNPNAVVLSLWPSAVHSDDDDDDGTGGAHRSRDPIDVSKSYLRRAGATVLYESAVDVPACASTLLVMAMYWGEDWLRTNCWYDEQPLEDLNVPGLARPTGHWPGAEWKRELCFRRGRPGGTAAWRMHVLIADTGGGGGGRLWSDKYAVRAEMSRDTGRAGNSCMHLTDDQSGIVAAGGSGGSGAPPLSSDGGSGTACNASYAFACARCLLNPGAMEFLVRCATERFVDDDDRRGDEFEGVFGNFCRWLGDRDFEDVVALPLEEEEDGGEGGGNGATVVKTWNPPPI